jgi:hypothetical protein
MKNQSTGEQSLQHRQTAPLAMMKCEESCDANETLAGQPENSGYEQQQQLASKPPAAESADNSQDEVDNDNGGLKLPRRKGGLVDRDRNNLRKGKWSVSNKLPKF